MELEDFQKELCEKIAYDLGSAFVWEDTKEGHRYWSEVKEKLLEMAEK